MGLRTDNAARQQAEQAGATDFLVKPLNTRRLAEILARVFHDGEIPARALS